MLLGCDSWPSLFYISVDSDKHIWSLLLCKELANSIIICFEF